MRRFHLRKKISSAVWDPPIDHSADLRLEQVVCMGVEPSAARLTCRISCAGFARARSIVLRFSDAHRLPPQDAEAKVMEPHKCVSWEWLPWPECPRPVFMPLEQLLAAAERGDFDPFAPAATRS